MSQTSIFDSESCHADGRHFRVLIVDDSRTARGAMARSLEDYNFEVFQLEKSTEAVAEAIERQPDVIISDVEMPELDGFDLCLALKAEPRTADIPVLFVTSSTRPEQLILGFEVGGSDFIGKDAEAMELIARVRTHLHLATLQKELKHQLAEIKAQAEVEKKLRSKIEEQQSQMLQNEKMASIGQLAAGVAHEINNPIGFISSNLNTLNEYLDDIKAVLDAYQELKDATQNGGDSAEAASKVEAVCKEVDLPFLIEDLDSLIAESVEGTGRVRQIVADLRDFSHVDSPDLGVEDLNVMLEKTLNVAHNELKYQATVKTEFGDIPEVACFGGKLTQVFLNLIVNAAQSLDEAGTVTVRTGCSDDRQDVWVEVADTGCGIPEENLKRIFDPFFTTKDVGKGTGLGLNLAYNIVQSHDGKIDVDSVVGKGTTFRINLPAKGPKATQTPGTPGNPEDKELAHEQAA
ncbi:MAG: ATP-binding protein [Planctomycetota bacterium]